MKKNTRAFGPPAKAQITVATCGGRGLGSAGGKGRSSAQEAMAYHRDDIGRRRLRSLRLEHLPALSLRSDQKAATCTRACARRCEERGLQERARVLLRAYVPCAAKRDHISKGVDDAERPNVPTWGGHGAQQALRHARQVRGVQECYSLQNDMKPRKLKTMPVHMQAMHPRTRSLKDMLGHSAFFSGSTVACIA